MSSHLYRKISIITYNNNNYQVFRDEKGRYAFLRVDEQGKFHYPEITEFVGLANIFSQEPDKIAFFKGSKNTLKFTASLLVAGAIMSCSGALFKELKLQNQFDNNSVQEYISVADDYEEELADIEEVVVTPTPTPTPTPAPLQTEETQAQYQKSKQVTADMYKKVGNTIYIYDSTALNKFLGEKEVTLDDIIDAINSNTSIPSELKPIVLDFARKERKTYPNLDMRLFYENMKNIKFKYLTQQEINNHGDVTAWYDWSQMTIYINKDIDLTPGSYDLKVIRHELSHTISLAEIVLKDGTKLSITIKEGNYGTYIQEAVAVILSKDPFEKEYPDDDFGYGLIANEFESLTDIIPECDISILANKDINTIEKYFDNNFHCNIKAQRLFDLMELQTIVYYNINNVKMSNDDFKDIYRYIAQANLEKRVTPNMSYAEIKAIQNELKHNLTKSINLSMNLVYVDVIDEEFNNYMVKNNITQSSLKR